MKKSAPMRLEYNIGDKVWFFEPNHQGKPTKGVIYGWTQSDHIDKRVYVIAVPVPGIGEFIFHANEWDTIVDNIKFPVVNAFRQAIKNRQTSTQL